jgi:arylsulfatase A-like enzyme
MDGNDRLLQRPGGGLSRRTFLRDSLGAGVALAGLSAAPAVAAKHASSHPKRRESRPNILVIVVDELRAPRWFGAGGRVASLPPNIARLARAGVSFTRYYTASTDCTPARAALLTGLHTHQTGCMITGASTLDPGFPTWGTMLREQGYSTYWYGKWHLTRGDGRWDELNGPPALDQYGFDGGTYPSPDGAPGQGWRVDPIIAAQFDAWYEQAAGDGPWCTTVSFVNPHDIAWWWRWSLRCADEADAPRSVAAMPPNFETPAQLIARRKPSVQLSLQDTSAVSFGAVPFEGLDAVNGWLPFLDLYVKLQLEVDRQVGAVLATLARRPRVHENTIVLFTSDHGEYGASHGLRGKGAGMYEEAVNVPLIVSDFSGRLGAVPNGVRHQLASSVDFAPLLLTLAYGTGDWRRERRYAHLAKRADLAAIVRDAGAVGREYALHATDEVFTEFALVPYAADAPRHVAGVITRAAKYATYSNWRGSSVEALDAGQQTELYDYTTRGGYLETDNVAGRSRLEHALRTTLEDATADELHAPLPQALRSAQRRGFADYRLTAESAISVSALERLHAVEKIVSEVESDLPKLFPRARPRHRRGR